MDNKCVVVGIAGGSGSGKTSFCNELEEIFENSRVKVIHTDNYFKNVKFMTRAPFSNKEYSDYDHPDSVDFENLCNDFNYSISSRLYDIVIIEGLLVLYFEDLRKKLDLKIYIDCRSEERLVRRIKRDIVDETFEEISSEYLDIVRYRHGEFVEPSKWHADLILNGSNYSQTATNIIGKWLLKISN
ncbi:AAA family ATPase [Priestia megaterium]